MRYKISELTAVVLGAIVIIAAQFSIPTLFGADGYLHIRMAEFLRQFGPHYDFHWARFSVFAHHFADKDFLYHVLLIPFTFLPNIFLGAKISAAVSAITLYLVFWAALRRYCSVRPLVPLFLAMFFCSAMFMDAILEARNITLVIALTIAFTHFLIQKKYLLLFITTAFYTLFHVSGPYLLLFALLGEGARFVSERDFSGRSVAAVALGLLAGFCLHPNFPNNFLIFYLNGILVPVFAIKWGLELGAEFFPLNTREYALGYPMIFAAVLLFIGLGMSQKKKISTATQIWMAIAGYFFLFSFFSRRYLVHAYPVVLIALAGYISEWLQARQGLLAMLRSGKARWCVIALAVVLLGVVIAGASRDFRQRTAGETIYNRHFEAVGAWMAQNLPAGEVIFHANWSDSQYLIGTNPKDDYFVTLDPIYMYWQDREKYKLYREVAFGGNSDPYSVLKNEFGVTYGYAGKNYFMGLINQIKSDKHFEILGEDGMGLIFKLK